MEAGQQPLRVAGSLCPSTICAVRPWWAWATQPRQAQGPAPSSWFSAVCPEPPSQRLLSGSREDFSTGGHFWGQWGRSAAWMSRSWVSSSSSVAEGGRCDSGDAGVASRLGAAVSHRAPAAFQGASWRCRGQGLAPPRLSSPRVLCQILGCGQPLHPCQEAPAGMWLPQRAGVRCPAATGSCLQAQHEGPCSRQHPAGTQVGPLAAAGAAATARCVLDRRPRAGCLACTPASAGATPDLLPAALGLPPALAWPGRAPELALTSSCVPSCPSGCSCQPCPGQSWVGTDCSWSNCSGQSASSDEVGDSAQGHGCPAPGAGHLAAWLSDCEPRPPGRGGQGLVHTAASASIPRLLPRAWWVCCSCRASRVKSWLQSPERLLGSAQVCYLPALGIAPALLCDAGRGVGCRACQEGDWECPRL